MATGDHSVSSARTDGSASVSTFDLWSFAQQVRADLCEELSTAIAVQYGEVKPPDDWGPELERRKTTFIEGEMRWRLSEYDSIADDRAEIRANYEQEQRRRLLLSKYPLEVVVSQTVSDRIESIERDLIAALRSALCGPAVKVTARYPAGGEETMRHLDIDRADIDFRRGALTSGDFRWLDVQVEVAPLSADKRPLLSDLRDSGTIEQDADVVMFIYREEYYLERGSEADRARLVDVAGRAELLIAKHRNGPTGVVHLHFDGAMTKFADPGSDDLRAAA
jgi:hypothetical protein